VTRVATAAAVATAEEWSWHTVRHGAAVSTETSGRGDAVRGLDDALGVFGIHPRQCGVPVHAADALAAALAARRSWGCAPRPPASVPAAPGHVDHYRRQERDANRSR